MIRVLHIDTERTWRGGEAQVLGLVRHLPSESFLSIVAAPRKSPLLEKSVASDLRVLPLTGVSEFSLRMVAHLLYGIRLYAVDLIHVHTSHGLIAADLSRRILRKPIPIVCSRRTDFHLRTSFLGLSRLKYTRCADRILTVSDAIRNILISDGICPERIETVYSGIDIASFPESPDRVSARESLGIRPGTRVIGMVGALADHKDPLLFLEAARRVSESMENIVFMLVGAGRLWETLRAAHARSGLGDRFRLTGFQTDVRRFLAAFDLFCMTSREEGLCTSILDAMAMRLPVVATRAGGIPEAVQDGTTGLLANIGDPESVAAHIRSLLSDPDRARHMGDAGRRRVETIFDIRQTAESTARAYDRLMEHVRS